ncbi:MAG: ZIP family metal transporter, partial [Anaerolineae bacterium]|nr:ZIP family metal transporter [Anaerolineae bacterium]
AAGAMLYVVSDEMIPETHRRGFEREGTLGVLVGFAVMMLLDNLFG